MKKRGGFYMCALLRFVSIFLSLFNSRVNEYVFSKFSSLTGSSVGLGPCLTTLGNSPVYWGGLLGRFSGALRDYGDA